MQYNNNMDFFSFSIQHRLYYTILLLLYILKLNKFKLIFNEKGKGEHEVFSQITTNVLRRPEFITINPYQQVVLGVFTTTGRNQSEFDMIYCITSLSHSPIISC